MENWHSLFSVAIFHRSRCHFLSIFYFQLSFCMICQQACHISCTLPTVMHQVTEGPAHTMNHSCFSVCFSASVDEPNTDFIKHLQHRTGPAGCTTCHFYPVIIIQPQRQIYSRTYMQLQYFKAVLIINNVRDIFICFQLSTINLPTRLIQLL